MKKNILKWIKIAILILISICLILVIWYKMPYTITSENTLHLSEPSENALYGDSIDVKLNIRVQRNLLTYHKYSGTVTVNGVEYTDETADIKRAWAFAPSIVSKNHAFTYTCCEWQGSKLKINLVVLVEDGNSTVLTMQDDDGNLAGIYSK